MSQRKKPKTIISFYSRCESESSNGMSMPSVSPPNVGGPELVLETPLASIETQTHYEPHHNDNALERDPGLRCAIWKYPVNDQDSVRRQYILLGSFQPVISFPFSLQGGQQRKFQLSWYKDYPWIEYSIATDRAYCFPCFLFGTKDDQYQAFIVEEFRTWKRTSGGDNLFMRHVGGITSLHNAATQKWDLLRTPSKQIEVVVEKLSSKEVEDNRLRLKASIECVRLLANQGAPFRGHDESDGSLNQGYFKEVLKSFTRMSSEVNRVVLGNAPGNAKYTSPLIQKQLLNILGNKMRNKIREEIGNSKYCILVDEAVDIARKEQMAIILRFVDCGV